jgi:hypothetical protein
MYRARRFGDASGRFVRNLSFEILFEILFEIFVGDVAPNREPLPW